MKFIFLAVLLKEFIMARRKIDVLSRITKELDKAASYALTDLAVEYNRDNNHLKEFLNGASDFSYEYFANEKVGIRTVKQDITSVLIYKGREIYLLCANFNNHKTLDNFKALINGFYIIVLANISALFNKSFAPASLDTDLSLLFLVSFVFFGKDEQHLIMWQLSKYLNYKIEESEEKNNIVLKCCYGGNSVLPLSLLLYSNYSNCEIFICSLKGLLNNKKKPLTDNIVDNLNEVYKNAYEQFLSNDSDTVTKVFSELCEYHLERCRKDSKEFYDFDALEWQLFPIEIISLIVVRASQNKDISMISHPVIDSFIPFVNILTDKTEWLTDFSIDLRNELFKRSGYSPFQ